MAVATCEAFLGGVGPRFRRRTVDLKLQNEPLYFCTAVGTLVFHRELVPIDKGMAVAVYELANRAEYRVVFVARHVTCKCDKSANVTSCEF